MEKKTNNKKLIPDTRYQIPDTNSGFTLIELLITIFLISVGLIGVIAFFNASLQSQFDAKNEVIAAGLAQEGKELIRNIVDYNYLNGNNWWTNLVTDTMPITAPNNKYACKTDYNSLTTHNCADTNKKSVCVTQAASGTRYFQCVTPMAGQTLTDFSRTVDIKVIHSNGLDCKNASPCDLNAGDCISITSEVYWSNKEKSTASDDIICKPRQ